MKKIILLFCILSLYQTIKAQSGLPDPSFGNNGAIITSADSTGNLFSPIARKCLIQPDGTIFLVLQSNNKTRLARRFPNGDIDPGYGINGYSVVVSMNVTTAELQADGKIVVAGGTDDLSDFMLARYNTDGTLDASFGNGGIVITDFGSTYEYIIGMVITATGQIIAGGSNSLNGYGQFLLAGYTAAGVPDPTFGNNGIVTTDFNSVRSQIYALALQPDGKVVAAGIAGGNFGLTRYNPDGSPDLSFNFTGQTTTHFSGLDWAKSVVIASNGKIYAGGESYDASFIPHYRVARYNVDGSLDLTFNSGSGSVYQVIGATSYDYLTNIRLQNDGKIIASGTTSFQGNGDMALTRINTDGTIDNSFGTSGNGIVIADFNSGSDENDFLVIQQDDKIVTGGYNYSPVMPSYAFSCFRFNPDGTPDAGFGVNGSFIDFVPGSSNSYNALFQQADGKLLAENESNYGTSNKVYLSRFNADGTPDNAFGQNGKYLLAPTYYGSSYFQPDGRLLYFGYSPTNNGDVALSRYNSDGSTDATFGTGGTVTSDFGGSESATAALVQPDGKIIVSGYTRNNSGSDGLVARYNPDGSVDGSFGTNGYVAIDLETEDFFQAIAIAPDGKIVLGGYGYTYPPDFSYFHFDVEVVRLNPDGSRDLTFGQQGTLVIDKAQTEYLGRLAVLNDNKILLTRFQGDFGPQQVIYLQRLNIDGTDDNTFGQNGNVLCDGSSLLLQGDQKIVVSGYKKNNLNNTDFLLARFNSDGTPDLSFGTNGKTISSFTHMDNYIGGVLISGSSLFATGYGVDLNGIMPGIIAKYQLGIGGTLTCLADTVVNTDSNLCSAKVYGIDPVSTSGNVAYTLTGATTANGSGPASGLVFNKGVTTVTYALSSDATQSCSFTVTLQDKQPPVIENLTASPSALWPPDHKLKTVTLSYAAHDNCGIAGTQVTVTSNDPAQSGEDGDLSPDWEIADAHHVRLRAEKLKNGKERIYTIKVTVTDAAGNQTSATVNVTVPKSNGNANPNLIVTATPNPSSNYFVITIHSNSNDKINARLLDDNGIIINTVSNISAPQTFKIGEKLRAGIYFLQVTQYGKTQTIKLIKQ